MIFVATLKEDTNLYRIAVDDTTQLVAVGGIKGMFHRVNGAFICIDPAADFKAMMEDDDIEVACFETVPDDWAKLLFIGFQWPILT